MWNSAGFGEYRRKYNILTTLKILCHRLWHEYKFFESYKLWNETKMYVKQKEVVRCFLGTGNNTG